MKTQIEEYRKKTNFDMTGHMIFILCDDMFPFMGFTHHFKQKYKFINAFKCNLYADFNVKYISHDIVKKQYCALIGKWA